MALCNNNDDDDDDDEENHYYKNAMVHTEQTSHSYICFN